MNPIDRSSPRRRWTGAAVALGLGLLAACASTPPPDAQLAVGRAAVERANGTAGQEAPSELALARDKMQRAQAAYADKDYTRARQLSEQATADANLAEAQARSVRSQRALTEVREGIRQLREEMDRK